MQLVGTEIAPFAATAFRRGRYEVVSNDDLMGRWSVFFFYASRFPQVSQDELEDLADHHDEFAALDVDLYSVSTDTHCSHMAWHASSPTIAKIRYAMVGDPTGQIANNFDNMRPGEWSAERGTFVIDPAGVIRLVEMASDGVGRLAGDLLRNVTELVETDRNGQMGPPSAGLATDWTTADGQQLAHTA